MTLGVYLGAGTGVTKGLYHLEGNSTDASGNGYNGTDTAVTYGLAYGKYGQGALFNGTTSKISIGAHWAAAAGTIAWWMKPVAITNLKRPWGDTGGYLYAAFNASNQMRIEAYDVGGKTTGYVTLSTSLREWWVVTWNSTNVYLYKNGVQAATVGCGAIGDVSGALQLGGTTGVFANVEIDEFILENVAWSATKIQKYYTFARGWFR